MRSNGGNIKKKIWKVNLFIDNFEATIKLYWLGGQQRKAQISSKCSRSIQSFIKKQNYSSKAIHLRKQGEDSDCNALVRGGQRPGDRLKENSIFTKGD